MDDSLQAGSQIHDRQMLFGASVVHAALLARKRNFCQLFTCGEHINKKTIVDMARKLKIDIAETDNRGVLNNFTGNRPHNGFVLECGPLPEISVSSLGSSSQAWLPVLENTDVMHNQERTFEMPSQATHDHPIYIFLDEVVRMLTESDYEAAKNA